MEHKTHEITKTFRKKVDIYPLAFAVLWLSLVGLYIRVAGLREYYFSPDDAITLWVSSKSHFSELWRFSSYQPHPPLKYIFLHLLMKISRNELLLRSVSLVPGVVLITAFFFLGRKVGGTVAGIAMSYMAAFSYGAILVSQGTRNYSLEILFLAAAYWFFLAFSTRGDKRSLLGYGVFMSLAIFANYTAVIPLLAFLMFWLTRMASRRESPRKSAAFLTVHFVIFFLLSIILFSHMRALTSRAADPSDSTGYLKPLFPGSLEGLAENLLNLHKYLFTSYVAYLTLALMLFGFFALLKRKRGDMAAVTLITFAITFILALLGKAPFGGGRQSMYLFPMVVLLMGASIQYFFDVIAGFFSKRSRIGVVSWVEKHHHLFIASAIAVLIASTVLLASVYKSTDFLRAYRGIHGASYREFPIKQNDYEQLFSFFDDNPPPGEIILTNKKTSYYFLWSNGGREAERLSASMARTVYSGRECFYIRERNFENEDAFLAAVRELRHHFGETTLERIWLVNLGWEDGVGEKLLANPTFAPLIDEQLKLRGSFVIGFKGDKLFEMSEQGDDSAVL